MGDLRVRTEAWPKHRKNARNERSKVSPPGTLIPYTVVPHKHYLVCNVYYVNVYSRGHTIIIRQASLDPPKVHYPGFAIRGIRGFAHAPILRVGLVQQWLRGRRIATGSTSSSPFASCVYCAWRSFRGSSKDLGMTAAMPTMTRPSEQQKQ
jgi:hypothetical protein